MFESCLLLGFFSSSIFSYNQWSVLTQVSQAQGGAYLTVCYDSNKSGCIAVLVLPEAKQAQEALIG